MIVEGGFGIAATSNACGRPLLNAVVPSLTTTLVTSAGRALIVLVLIPHHTPACIPIRKS